MFSFMSSRYHPTNGRFSLPPGKGCFCFTNGPFRFYSPVCFMLQSSALVLHCVSRSPTPKLFISCWGKNPWAAGSKSNCVAWRKMVCAVFSRYLRELWHVEINGAASSPSYPDASRGRCQLPHSGVTDVNSNRNWTTWNFIQETEVHTTKIFHIMLKLISLKGASQ